jgi:hypothetical protein
MDFDILFEAEVLRGFEIVCRKSRRRNWFHPYLAAVFTLAVDLKQRGILDETARKLAKKLDLHLDRRTHPIKTIIDASSKADLKTRSRWGKTLRYAFEDKDDEEGEWNSTMTLSKYFVNEGGVARCAAKIAKRRRPKKKGKNEWPKD